MANENYIDGGEAILEAFRQLDIDYVIASPGSEWGSVWEAFARQERENRRAEISELRARNSRCRPCYWLFRYDRTHASRDAAHWRWFAAGLNRYRYGVPAERAYGRCVW